MTTIVHISDLHIGNGAFNEKIYLNAVNQINDLNPDIIVLTGDITDNGYYSDFQRCEEYLKLFESQLLTVPGNHDARNVGYEIFEELVGDLTWAWDKNKELTILGLDSSDPDVDRGHIGRLQQSWMEKELDKCYRDSKFSIVAMHHHVIPIPKTGRERNVLSDAGDILKSLTDNNVDMVICGHKHVPHLWQLKNTLFVNAGSTSSTKLRGKNLNSYNIYTIADEEIEVVLKQVEGNDVQMGKFSRINKHI